MPFGQDDESAASRRAPEGSKNTDSRTAKIWKRRKDWKQRSTRGRGGCRATSEGRPKNRHRRPRRKFAAEDKTQTTHRLNIFGLRLAKSIGFAFRKQKPPPHAKPQRAANTQINQQGLNRRVAHVFFASPGFALFPYLNRFGVGMAR